MGHKWNTSRAWRICQFWVFDYWRFVTNRAYLNVLGRYKIWEEFEDFRSISKIIMRCSNWKRSHKKTGRQDIILLVDLEVKEGYFKSIQIWQFERPINKTKVKGLLKCITCTIVISSDDLHGLALIPVIDKGR